MKAYSEIIEVRLYFGEDKHPKSTAFLEKAVQIGYTVIRKSVKYILIAEIEGQKVYRRKCDFDMETCIDVHRLLNDGFESFIFFTGDGDFEPLYRLLISKRKQVIVVYAHGHLGREIYQMHGGLYKVAIDKLTENVFKEMSTTSSGEGAK